MYHRHSSNCVTTDMMSEIHYTIIAFIGGEHRKLSSRHCFPWSLMFTSYEGNTCFIISKLLWYCNYNYGTGLGKNGLLTHFPTSWCQGLYTEQQPIAFLYIIYAWGVHRVVSVDSKFSAQHPNCLITFK